MPACSTRYRMIQRGNQTKCKNMQKPERSLKQKYQMALLSTWTPPIKSLNKYILCNDITWYHMISHDIIWYHHSLEHHPTTRYNSKIYIYISDYKCWILLYFIFKNVQNDVNTCSDLFSLRSQTNKILWTDSQNEQIISKYFRFFKIQ